MSLSNEDVLEILALLDASGFDELRLETADYKLYLNRSGTARAAPALPEFPPREAPAAALEPVAVASPPAATQPGGRDVAEVKAPLLGTFYGAPQPGAAPFVTVGTSVDPDTVVGIVEVMKLMNSISAGVAGVVVEIVAKDGQLVEYGEALVRIARSKE